MRSSTGPRRIMPMNLSPNPMDQREFSGREILAGKAPDDAPVTGKGWVRTRRDSKAGISFLHLSDVQSFHPLHVVAPDTLPHHAGEVRQTSASCAGASPAL